MAKNATKKKKIRKGSFFLGALDRFTTFIYSLFHNGRFGTWLSEDSVVYNNSYCARAVEGGSEKLKKSRFSSFIESVGERSRVMRFLGSVRNFLFSMSLSVYGLFFMVYGLVSMLVYYLMILLGGSNPHGDSAFIVALIVVVCSIPMLVSTSSAATYVSESKQIKKFLVSLLSIPIEKLKTTKRYSGIEIMLPSAILAAGFGALTYFLHPSYLLIGFLAILLFCVITANPESGIIVTIGMVPFLQFTNTSEILLVVMLVVTCFSYLSKLLRHRRTVRIGAECLIVAIFCGFVLVTGIFSSEGMVGFFKSAYATLIIFAGFFVTYNLIKSEEKLLACTKTLAIAFLAVAIIGLWSLFYDGVVDGVIYSMREYVSPILEEQSIGFRDGAEVFGVLSVLVFPLLFAYIANRNTISGLVMMLIFTAVSLASVFVYGTYETVLAIIIEFFIFWLLYSNKTVNVVAFLLLPIGIFAIMFPYIAAYFDWRDPLNFIVNSLPLSFENSPSYVATVESGFEMIFDGNITGIGVGNEVFQKIHASYANVVSANASDPGSFYLQLFCWSGIGGVITFTVFMLLLFKGSYGYVLTSRDKAIRRKSLALFTALFTAMIYGSVNCLWSDMRMLFLFWACAGLLAGFVREGRDREQKIENGFSEESDSSEIELRFYK